MNSIHKKRLLEIITQARVVAGELEGSEEAMMSGIHWIIKMNFSDEFLDECVYPFLTRKYVSANIARDMEPVNKRAKHLKAIDKELKDILKNNV
jgi:hypothetical protein